MHALKDAKQMFLERYADIALPPMEIPWGKFQGRMPAVHH
jgi:hypothetical protein